MKFNLHRTALMVLLMVIAESNAFSAPKPGVATHPFGKLSDGKTAQAFVLTNKNGLEVTLTDFGAVLVSFKAPDKKGKMADVVLGYDSGPGYETDTASFGGTVGRYANRIAKGEFKLDGKTYHVTKNDGPNTLHGGKRGFNKKCWTAKDVSSPGVEAVQFTVTSPDGDEGFPGNLKATVTYSLNDQNELHIRYTATTDKPTVVNLTNHAYWNLKGEGTGEIVDHEVMIKADKFTPVDATLIPTGELKPVAGTPFDFTKSTKIGARINQNDPQLKLGIGYDHNFVLATSNRPKPVLAAEAYEPASGRVLQILTTEPGLQFYTGNHLDGPIGKGGHKYAFRNGFCFESQHFPDSPNHQSFPSTELKPGQTYTTETIYKLSTR